MCIWHVVRGEGSELGILAQTQCTSPISLAWIEKQPQVRSQGSGGMQKTVEEHW